MLDIAFPMPYTVGKIARKPVMLQAAAAHGGRTLYYNPLRYRPGERIHILTACSGARAAYIVRWRDGALYVADSRRDMRHGNGYPVPVGIVCKV